MIYLNEWFPNPVGPDANGEFVELYNSGASAVGLNGWTLVTEGKKRFSLSGYAVPAHGYLVLRHAQTKLSLKNTAGGLAVYDAAGRLVDQGSFLGAAPDGESYSRVDYGAADTGHFAFVAPTPGAANKTIPNALAVQAHPFGAPLNRPLDAGGFLAIMMGTTVLVTGLIIYATHAHEDLSKLFLRGDHEGR